MTRILMVSTLGFTMACLCGGSMTPEEKAAWEAKRAQEKAEKAEAEAAGAERTRKWAGSLATIERELDPDERAPKACDAAAFAGIPDNALVRIEIPTINYESLPGAEPYGDKEDWSWLDDRDLMRLPKVLTGEEKNDAFIASWGQEPQNRFVAVFVATERILPTAVTGRGIIAAGEFDSGIWKGQVRLLDLESRAIVCGASIAAENSEEVDFDDRGAFKDDPAKVTLVDFQQNLEDAANDALDKIAPRFKVNFVGIF